MKKALSLYYDKTNPPVVSSRASGELAEKLIALAKKHHIPIQENPVLIEKLINTPTGQQIPEALYEVVAQIIAFAWYIDDCVQKQQKS